MALRPKATCATLRERYSSATRCPDACCNEIMSSYEGSLATPAPQREMESSDQLLGAKIHLHATCRGRDKLQDAVVEHPRQCNFGKDPNLTLGCF
eukprot:3236324-Amphidinium_carterae.1